ncbi:MAG: S1 RNA-binding domain-containing protein [Spirochaetes bacterium]|nr:S1 RNA-binding domain-containing protein [Spirochaetota bacterium]
MSEKIVNFEEELEKSLQTIQEPQAGSIIEGKIVCVNNSEVFVDIGWTQEITISIDEFDSKPNELDKVYIYCFKDKYDRTIFSKKKADEILLKRELSRLLKEGLPIKGFVKRYIKEKKLFQIDVKGVSGICFADKIDLKDFDEKLVNDYIEKVFDFKILSYNNNKLVLSRKDYLIDKAKIEKIKFFKERNKKDIVKCKVKKILENDKGVIVDIDSFEGFIPRKEISYSKYFNISDILSEGQIIDAEIIELNKKEDKIILSYKNTKKDPWENLKLKEGDIVKSKVVKVFPEGLFVNIEEGLDGYIYKKDLSWFEDFENEKNIAKEGNIVEGKILRIDRKNRKIIIGIKHILPNPFEKYISENGIGKKVKGKIDKVTDFGVFIELDRGVTGLLKQEDLSWTEELNPSKLYSDKVGSEIEVVIKNIDTKKKRIDLSLKDLFDNPWDNFLANNKIGSNVETLVSEVEERKLVVKLNQEIKGIIPASEVSTEKVFNLAEKFKIGDKIIAKIKTLEPKKKRVVLSIKDYIEEEQSKELGKFLFDHQETKITLGKLLNNNK